MAVVRACLDGTHSLVFCSSPEDADRWRADLAALVPDEVSEGLVEYSWPGQHAPRPVPPYPFGEPDFDGE